MISIQDDALHSRIYHEMYRKSLNDERNNETFGSWGVVGGPVERTVKSKKPLLEVDGELRAASQEIEPDDSVRLFSQLGITGQVCDHSADSSKLRGTNAKVRNVHPLDGCVPIEVHDDSGAPFQPQSVSQLSINEAVSCASVHDELQATQIPDSYVDGYKKAGGQLEGYCLTYAGVTDFLGTRARPMDEFKKQNGDTYG
jgi:hypothetical protein